MTDDAILLRTSLEVAVQLWIQLLQARPWSTFPNQARCQVLVALLAEHGDDVLYRSRKRGGSATAFNALAEAIATLAFAPGGVTAFGLHFEAQHPEAGA